MSKSTRLFGLLLPIAILPTLAHATGDWQPHTWLEDGGQALLQAPEFYWELECKRIAQDFVPKEKAHQRADNETDETTKADTAEYEEAVKSGYIKTSDAAAAIKNHQAYRAVFETANAKAAAEKGQGAGGEPPPQPENNGAAPAKVDPLAAPPVPIKADGEPDLPAEPDSEFADYNKGALHYGHGSDTSASQAAWAKILQRPAAQRKYRSTWAAYMLGKLAIDAKQYPEAIKYFQQTRQLAQDGFADSLGLAADSYGWEGKAELELHHMDKAARLYLTQLALDDISAVDSLKYLIPDRDTGTESTDKTSKPDLAAAQELRAALEAAAADPVLRRLETAHILCVGVASNYDQNTQKNVLAPQRQANWLKAIQKAKVKKTADAEELGWVAYTMGQYADAEHWLSLSDGKSVSALWLKGKLALHDGKLAEGAKLLEEAMKPLTDSPLDQLGSGEMAQPGTALRGDLGTLLLSRGDFVQAFQAFFDAHLWEDAAYVAERVFTKKELIDYVDKHFPEPPAEAAPDKDKDNDKAQPAATEEDQWKRQSTIKVRRLLARRLVREDDYATARKYFAPDMQATLDSYTAALAKGLNTRLPKKDQAHSLFVAAWIARIHGMELMGTEAGPDVTSYDGDTSLVNVAMLRLTGKIHQDEDPRGGGEEQKPADVTFAAPVSEEEKKRLAASKLNPERRFHYRHVAAGLAWKAAGLLPDGAEETADVLNSAGNWLKDRNEKAADRFYQALEKRCPKTKIGRDAIKKHWFSDIDGAWSTQEGGSNDDKK